MIRFRCLCATKKWDDPQSADFVAYGTQVEDDTTVEDVYKYISEKIGLKPGRKLLLTSGCRILDASRPLLPQVQTKRRYEFCRTANQRV